MLKTSECVALGHPDKMADYARICRVGICYYKS